MKTSNYILLLLVVVILLIATSCQKTIDANTQNTVQASAQSSDLFGCNNCLVTHTENNASGDVLDFFYNKEGNPDSLNVNGVPIKIRYDRFGRPEKENFINSASITFKYKNWSFLPVVLTTTYLSDGTHRIDSFRYNLRGEMIRHSVTYPEYNSAHTEYLTYKYGNVQKVDFSYSSSTYSFNYTEFIATKYDNKPNLMTGSRWTKFLLFETNYEGLPFGWMLFSKNNAADYTWIYDADNPAYSYSIKSTFQYNNSGFANIVNMDWFDNSIGEDEGSAPQTSLSTCDNTVNTLQPFSSVKPSILSSKLKQITKRLPIIIPQKTNN